MSESEQELRERLRTRAPESKPHPVAVRLYRDTYLTHLRERFMRYSNPLWVWLAYRVARSRQASSIDREASIEETFALPSWIVAYFDHAADGLLGGQELDEALGFAMEGGRSKRLQFVDEAADGVDVTLSKDVAVGADVAVGEQPAADVEAAAGDVAPDGVSRSEVFRRRRWHVLHLRA